MHKKRFNKFINWGIIDDKNIRSDIAEGIYNQLQLDTNTNISISKDMSISKYDFLISEIVNSSSIKELSVKDSSIAENVTNEVINFINNTEEYITNDNPFAEEEKLQQSFENCSKDDFRLIWKSVKEYLEKNYTKQEIQTDFYEKEFRQSLLSANNQINSQFENVKKHFNDSWKSLLFKKHREREIEIIDKKRKDFLKSLYEQIEKIKKLQNLINPITDMLGRLWDMSKGNWRNVNFNILNNYASLLEKDKHIQELAEMLGKMHAADKKTEEVSFVNYRMKTAWKINHASKSDIIGVRESDDLSSLLPSEIAFLSDASLENIFLKRFADKKLQTFEYQAKIAEAFKDKKLEEKEEDKKGPFIICVDTSGSMHGTPETIAKTLSFALLKMAIKENRKCYLISFSTSIMTLDLSDIKNSLEKIISFLSMSFNGGTDASPAMREALRMIHTEDYKKADILMISDFVMGTFDSNIQNAIRLAKDNETKFHSLVIGYSQNNQTIKDFDNNWFYNPNNKNSVLTLVEQIKSL